MESNQKRILVMAESADTGQLYQSMLASGGYKSIKVCTDTTNFFELATHSHPHLIIWHLNPLSFEATLEILSNIRQTYGDEDLAILLSVPTDWFNSQIEKVADRVLEFMMEPAYFIRVVEELLQKKLKKRGR